MLIFLPLLQFAKELASNDDFDIVVRQIEDLVLHIFKLSVSYAWRNIVLTLLLKSSMEALVIFPKRQNPRISSQCCDMIFAILCC